MKTSPTVEWEIKYGHPKVIVVGVDEVGRGCLAGPVVAAAVVLSTEEFPEWLVEVTDSKLLSPQKREQLAPRIQNWVKAYCIASASVEEIDKINIHHASQLAMVRAVDGLAAEGKEIKPHTVLVDGNFALKSPHWSSIPIIKGDQKSLSIACASIIAKVWRDQLMCQLELTVPGYGFSVHKGYPTTAHTKALQELGPSIHHRHSFGPVARLLHHSRG